MTSIAPPLVDGCFYIDNSSMELFTTCPRQAYYYIIRRLELNRSKVALDFGGAFHNVLEFTYKNFKHSYRSAADNAQILQFTALQSYPVPEDDYRTTSYLLDAVSKYLNDYPAEAFEIATLPNGQPAVEVPFAMPIGTVETASWGKVTVIWTGKIDLIYRSRTRLGIMDHKTTSMMGPQFFTEFEIAHQMYGYNAAAEFIMGEECGEITINGLGCRKPTVKGKGEKFEFNRHIIPTTRPLLDEWHTDSLALVSDFLSHCERGYFPKATKWCMGKYGACQFRQVCTLNPANRELALSTSEFKPVTWNPLEKKP